MRILVGMLLMVAGVAAPLAAGASTYGPDFPYHRVDQAKVGVDVVPLDSLSRFGHRSGPFTDYCPRYLPAEHCWTYRLVWQDGATVTHEPIHERLLLYAIDAAGNVSATADTLEVTDPGRP